MPKEEHEVFEVRHRLWWLGSEAKYTVEAVEGKRGRWRWEAIDVDTGKVVALSTVVGWETRDEAEQVAREFFLALGAELRDIEE